MGLHPLSPPRPSSLLPCWYSISPSDAGRRWPWCWITPILLSPSLLCFFSTAPMCIYGYPNVGNRKGERGGRERAAGVTICMHVCFPLTSPLPTQKPCDHTATKLKRPTSHPDFLISIPFGLATFFLTSHPPPPLYPCFLLSSHHGEGGDIMADYCMGRFCGVLLCHNPLMICHDFQTLCFKVTFICFAIFDLLLFC